MELTDYSTDMSLSLTERQLENVMFASLAVSLLLILTANIGLVDYRALVLSFVLLVVVGYTWLQLDESKD